LKISSRDLELWNQTRHTPRDTLGTIRAPLLPQAQPVDHAISEPPLANVGHQHVESGSGADEAEIGEIEFEFATVRDSATGAQAGFEEGWGHKKGDMSIFAASFVVEKMDMVILSTTSCR
jgi:hypothetical protein